MSKVKIAFTLAAAAGILILGAMVVYFSPPVQRRVVARLVDPRPGDEYTIEYARVGLTKTEIRGFNLQRPDIGYRIGSLSADLSVWDIYFREHVNISSIRATGLEFDFSRFVQEPRPEDADPFAGLLAELDVPVKLTLGEGLVDGRLLLPGSGEEPLTASFRVSGGGLEVGGEGRFELEALIEDPAADGWLRELAAHGQFVLTQTEAGRFHRLSGATNLRVASPATERGDELIAEVLMVREREGETYRARLHRAAEGEIDHRLLEVEARFEDADRTFRGDWRAWAESGQVAGFLYVERMPEFRGQGNGEFAFDTDSDALYLTGRFAGETGELSIVAGEMRGLGGVAVETAFEFRRDDEWLRVEEFALSIASGETGDTKLQAQSHYPFRYHRDTGRVESPSERTELLEVTARGAPIEWAGLFRDPEAERRLMLMGGDIVGRIMVSAHQGGLLVETVEPLRGDSISVATRGELRLADAGLLLNGAVSWIEGNVGLRLDPLEISASGKPALQINGSFSQIEELIEGRLYADVATLLAQPGLAVRDLVSGEIDAEFRGSLAGGIEASLIFKNGVMKEAEEPIPPVYLDLTSRRTEDGAREFRAPLRFDRPEAPTEVVLGGRIDDAAGRVDLQMTGEHLMLADVMDLLDAFERPEIEQDDERDEAPLWRGWEGSFKIAFTTIQFGDGYGLERPEFLFELSGDSLELTAEALFLGSPVAAEASLGFDPQAELPYLLVGELATPHTDLGVLFQTLQPERPPTVDGLFSLMGDLRGDGANAGHLFGRIWGELYISSSDGLLRLFYTDNPLVGVGLGMAGLLGGLGGELGTIIDIANELAEVPYDRVEVFLERDRGLDFRLRDLTLLGPEFHLSGSGILRHEAETAFLNQPMDLELQLAARGRLEELLGRAGLLSNDRDEYGYRQMETPFTIEGALADPDVSPFFTVVAGAVLELAAPIPGRAAEERERAAPPRETGYGARNESDGAEP